MKKLEKKIIRRVYKLETKRTIAKVVGEIFLVALVASALLFIFSIIIDILNYQSSFDLLDFFKDDFEMVRDYFFNNLSLFVQELPPPLMLVLILLLTILALLMYMLLKNFKKIKNKAVSIYKFWLKKPW